MDYACEMTRRQSLLYICEIKYRRRKTGGKKGEKTEKKIGIGTSLFFDAIKSI